MTQETARKKNIWYIVFTCIINIIFVIFVWLRFVNTDFIACAFSISLLISYFGVFVLLLVNMEKHYSYEKLEELQCINDNIANFVLMSVLQIVALVTYMYVQQTWLRLAFYVIIFGWCVFIILNIIVRYTSAEKLIPKYIEQSIEIQKSKRKSLDSSVECTKIQNKYEKLAKECKDITEKYNSMSQKVTDLNCQAEEYRIKAQSLQEKLKVANEEIAILKSFIQNSSEEE